MFYLTYGFFFLVSLFATLFTGIPILKRDFASSDLFIFLAAVSILLTLTFIALCFKLMKQNPEETM